MSVELTEEKLLKLLNELSRQEMIIIKFTAEWCGPCQAIKDLVEKLVKELPNSIKFYEIDIDESIELYAKLKNKKMVNGIPAILGYKAVDKEFWFVPDDSVLGGNKENIKEFFQRCIKYVKS